MVCNHFFWDLETLVAFYDFFFSSVMPDGEIFC